MNLKATEVRREIRWEGLESESLALEKNTFHILSRFLILELGTILHSSIICCPIHTACMKQRQMFVVSSLYATEVSIIEPWLLILGTCSALNLLDIQKTCIARINMYKLNNLPTWQQNNRRYKTLISLALEYLLIWRFQLYILINGHNRHSPYGGHSPSDRRTGRARASCALRVTGLVLRVVHALHATETAISAVR